MFRFSSTSLLALTGLLSTIASGESFETEVHPFLTKYCISCHGPNKQSASLRLDNLDSDVARGNDTDMWQEVVDRINLSEMPPEDAELQPNAAERGVATDALTALLRKAIEYKRSTGGRNVLRRLTAYEYNNTLRDLLQLDLKYAVDLPPEGTAQEGFKNNSSVLSTSALHIEYFERIARAALERIIIAPSEQPTAYYVHVEPEQAFEKKTRRSGDGKSKSPKEEHRVSYEITGEH